MQGLSRADALETGELGDGASGEVREVAVFLKESLGQFKDIAAANPGPEKDRQNLGIRKRINATP